MDEVATGRMGGGLATMYGGVCVLSLRRWGMKAVQICSYRSSLVEAVEVGSCIPRILNNIVITQLSFCLTTSTYTVSTKG